MIVQSISLKYHGKAGNCKSATINSDPIATQTWELMLACTQLVTIHHLSQGDLSAVKCSYRGVRHYSSLWLAQVSRIFGTLWNQCGPKANTKEICLLARSSSVRFDFNLTNWTHFLVRSIKVFIKYCAFRVAKTALLMSEYKESDNYFNASTENNVCYIDCAIIWNLNYIELSIEVFTTVLTSYVLF